jgi:sugar phosphate isomerase/epimerase
MNIKLGIIQGRLTTPVIGQSDEFYVGDNWRDEFEKIKKLENITLFDSVYKVNHINFIEWVITKHSFKNNPLFKNSLKKYPISCISAYNLLDKNFYKQDFLESNLVPILNAARKNNIQCVNIPVRELSNIQNEDIRKEFSKNIRALGRQYRDITFTFEFECWPEEILEVIKGYRNFKLTYDTVAINAFKGKQTHKFFLESLHKHIYNVKLHDKPIKGKSVEVGEGEIDFHELIANLMLVYKYNGNFTIQTNRGEPKKEMVTMANHVKYFVRIFANLKKLYGLNKNKHSFAVA